MIEDDGHRPPLASPQEFHSEADMSSLKLDSMKAGLPSPDIRVDFHGDPTDERPPLTAHL